MPSFKFSADRAKPVTRTFFSVYCVFLAACGIVACLVNLRLLVSTRDYIIGTWSCGGASLGSSSQASDAVLGPPPQPPPAPQPPPEPQPPPAPATPLCSFCPCGGKGRAAAEHAVFRHAVLVDKVLHVWQGGVDCGAIPMPIRGRSAFPLRTSFNIGQNTTPALEVFVVEAVTVEDFWGGYSCQEMVEVPALFGSFINWPQYGHAVYNGISHLYSAFFEDNSTGLLPATGATSPDQHAQLYLHADSKAMLRSQADSPFFDSGTVQPYLEMFTARPPKNLAYLLELSVGAPICFRHVVAGFTSSLDHYNGRDLRLARWLAFARAVRKHFGIPSLPTNPDLPHLQRLIHKRLSDRLTTFDGLGLAPLLAIDWARLHPRKPQVTFIKRTQNRRISNLDELAEVVRDDSRFGDPVVEDLMDLTVRQQIELMGASHVLVGADGTGIMNSLFMPEGGVVIQLRPVGCKVVLPRKGENIQVLAEAAPGRLLLWDPSQELNETMKEAAAKATTLGQKYSIILRQDILVPVAALRCLLDTSFQLLIGKAVDLDAHDSCLNRAAQEEERVSA